IAHNWPTRGRTWPVDLRVTTLVSTVSCVIAWAATGQNSVCPPGCSPQAGHQRSAAAEPDSIVPRLGGNAMSVVNGFSAIDPAPSTLPQDGINRVATAIMRPRRPQVPQQFGGGAAGLFQGRSQLGHSRKIPVVIDVTGQRYNIGIPP